MNDPIYAEIENRPRPTLFAASGMILLAAVGLWVMELALSLLAPGAGMLAANAVYYLPFMLLPAAICMARRRGLSAALRLNPLPLLPALSAVLLGLLSVYAASAAAAVWQGLLERLGLPALGGVPVPDSPAALMRSIVAMAALPAVCEELLFRGFALAAWETRGTAFAIGVTGALFALLHGNVTGLPAYLLVGAVAGYLVFALDSLYAGIVYHTVYNAACLVIPYMMAGETDAAEAALAEGISGGMAFVLAVEVLTVFALMAMLLFSLRARAAATGVRPIPRIRRPLSGRERAMLATAVGVMAVSNVIVAVLAGTGGGA